MDAAKYPHPWTQDQTLTDRLLKLVDDEDWDLFGLADVGPLNEKARPGRRPKDLWPTAKAVLMFAVGLADPFTRGWVQNGKSGKFYSYALLELDRRVWTVKRFLRQEGYLYFGGEAYGGALFDTGIRFADTMFFYTPTSVGKFVVLLMIQLFSCGLLYVYHNDRREAIR